MEAPWWNCDNSTVEATMALEYGEVIYGGVAYPYVTWLEHNRYGQERAVEVYQPGSDPRNPRGEDFVWSATLPESLEALLELWKLDTDRVLWG